MIWIRRCLTALIALLVAACAAPPERPIERHAMLDEYHVQYVDRAPEHLTDSPTALVFVHGWAASNAVFHEHVAVFARRYRVLSIDLLGHGRSDKPEIEYTMDVFARSVDAALQHAGVERAVFVGHSNGTAVARQFYRSWPAATLGIVAVDGSLRHPFEGRQDRGSVFVDAFRQDNYRATLSSMIDSMMARSSQELGARVRAIASSTPQHVLVGGIQAAIDPAIWDDTPIEVPVLAIMARQPAFEGDYEEHVRALCPRLEWHMWDDVGHYLMMEQPKRFQGVIDDWIVRNRLL